MPIPRLMQQQAGGRRTKPRAAAKSKRAPPVALLSSQGLLDLQRAAGNQAVVGVLRQTPPQLPQSGNTSVLEAAQKAVGRALASEVVAGGSVSGMVDGVRQEAADDPQFASGGSDLTTRINSLGDVKATALGGRTTM
jgi:hypothetical protein